MALDRSPATGLRDPRPILQLADVPVLCNQLWPDAAAARNAPGGDIDLVLDGSSGLLWNRAFDAGRMGYTTGYENALHHSPKFQRYAQDLARDLVDRHALRDKDVLEIGCGDGHMLSLMVERGVRSATGFDPSMADVASPHSARPEVTIVPEYFGAHDVGRAFDAILCRHVLEHIDEPLGFMSGIREAIGDRAVPVYIEVPNASWILDAVSVWDVIYEHVTYWTAPALETLMRRAGFRPTRVATAYGDQFLAVEAMPAEVSPDWLPASGALPGTAAENFGAAGAREIEDWRSQLADLEGSAVIWGAGSKGIAFANVLGEPASAKIAAMVDLNPKKHGRFVPGVGLPVIAPDDLPGFAPDLVIVANALYAEEVKARVRSLDLHPEFRYIAT